jgi:hypothetical protein
MRSTIDPNIVKELLEAKKYAKGRGIMLVIQEKEILKALLKLEEIQIVG